MIRINLLSHETSNKIAAGEVVERPSSVVKELIENSIDANAKNITVEINDGGKNKIKITDDGNGIYPSDIDKAFMPHATSKIDKIEDLYTINTFGFRGEALPSIASVSKIQLKSRVENSEFGKEIYICGGKTEHIKDVGCNVGTTINVKDLFFNVPARQKFLKTTQRETSLISNIINRLALANHNISFKYYNNEKKSLITFGTEDVKNTIRAIYGKNIYKNILNFEKHSDILSVYGYIGNADISRGSRNNQSIFVNKRYIKSGLITAAVENAFKSFSTVNKFPFFVLFLDIYPEFIDVNVHPTKSEIKFQDDRIVYKVVFNAVHEAVSNSIKNSFHIETNDQITNDVIDTDKTNDIKEINTKNIIEDTRTPVQIPIDLKKEEYTQNQIYKTENKQDDCFVEINKDKIQDKIFENKACFNEKNREPKFPHLDILGQFNNTYILAQNLDVFYMIDQHAAHEKILFEKFKNQIKNRKVLSQILLTPLVIELSAEDYVYYNENLTLFKESGFSTEIFGDNTISIREAPMLLGKVDVKNFFLEILDNIKNMGSGKIYEVKYNMIASLACKAAIKANHTLTHSEMNALIEELRYIDEPFNCPHGRPTIIKTPLVDIEKKFKRRV